MSPLGLARFASVQVAFGHEATDLVQNAKGVTLAVATPSGATTVEADYVVACDGGASATRERLGVKLVGSTSSERWLYWRDPQGQKHEHDADGDLFDAAQPPGYHVLDRAGLYQWGPDLPDDFIDAKLTPRRLVNVLKLAVSDRPRLKKMLALKSSVAKPARPWR